jgi:hypothetical protein
MEMNQRGNVQIYMTGGFTVRTEILLLIFNNDVSIKKAATRRKNRKPFMDGT